MRRADAFRVTRVELPERPPFALRQPLIGSNLWEVNLQALANDLKAQHPSLQDVRVIRRLPSTIRIEAIPRRPVAVARAGSWYPVDAAGFLLPEPSGLPPEHLVRLTGLPRALNVGKDNADERLQLALRVLQQVHRAPPLVATHVTEVNVADDHEIRFLLDLSGEETEVRCGSEAELIGQLSRLHAALKVMTKQQLPARYIDVRFPELVIGPRT